MNKLYKFGIWYSCLIYTKTVDSIEDALWWATQTPKIFCSSPPSKAYRSKLNKIFFFCAIQPHFFSTNYNNSSLQCWWLAVEIYQATMQLRKYPTLATFTSVMVVVNYSNFHNKVTKRLTQNLLLLWDISQVLKFFWLYNTTS